MKDIVSKLTFGFLMAQFVPGAIVVYSISFAYVTFTGSVPQAISVAASQALDVWMSPLRQVFIFVALATGAGMAIHGLHWAVLGFLESHYAEETENEGRRLKPVAETFWHDKMLILQILLGPIKIVLEVLALLFLGRNIRQIAIEENVWEIDKSKMEAFQFLEEFYLHFAQFYAHTSYALVGLFLSVTVSTLLSPGLAFGAGCVVALTAIWVVSGFFFIISRIQLASLFKAERAMCRASERASDE